MRKNRRSINTRKMHKYSNRNRRVSTTLSPIFYLFLAPTGKLNQKLQLLLAEDAKVQISSSPVIEKQRRPGPKNITYGIPSSEWPIVLQRVLKNKEPLRKVADNYGVSHETIRRMVRVAPRKLQAD